jgi:hydrophobe/amphiphile efflux-3 (HAE3) family protein
MLKRFARFVVRHRIAVIVFVLLVTGMFGYFARKVSISSDLLNLAPRNNVELVKLTRNSALFGSGTYVIISVKSDNAYSFSTLTKIKLISDELKKLPEVEEVMDPINAKVFKYLFGMLVVKQSFPAGQIPGSPEEIMKLKEEMLSEPTLKNVVVSENGENLALYLKMKNDVSPKWIRGEIDRILKPYVGPEKFYVLGRPVIEAQVKDYIQHDSLRLALPIVLLVVFVLFMNFQSLRGIVLPLVIMIGNIIWTIGLMGIFGKMITIIGIMLPVMILVNSSSYSIRFLNQYFADIGTEGDKRDNIRKSVVQIAKIIFLAAITTVAGFGALTPNKIRPMMEIGVFVLIGIIFSMTLSLTFLPALLTLLKKPRRGLRSSWFAARMKVPFQRLGVFIVRNHTVILIAACAVGLWAVVGIRNIKIDTSWERFFKKSSEILQTQRYIRSNYGGISTMNLNLETGGDGDLSFKNLEALRYAEKVEQWVREKGIFGQSTSFAGYVKRANQLLNGNDPRQYKLPETDADLLKILIMFKMTQFTESISNVITKDFRAANIIVRTSRPDGPEVTANQLKAFLKEFDKYNAENKFEGISVELSGTDIVFVSLVDYLVRNQLISIALSLVVVFLIVAVSFRSIVYGVYSLIPIVFGLLLNFAVMSYFRISLDFITAMISSIAVGMGVDNSIQYLITFSRTAHDLSLGDRLKLALVESGVPIFFSALTLIAGFTVLLFSSFKPILYFGLLINVTMIGCLVGHLFILPAFICLTKPKAIVSGGGQ